MTVYKDTQFLIDKIIDHHGGKDQLLDKFKFTETYETIQKKIPITRTSYVHPPYEWYVDNVEKITSEDKGQIGFNMWLWTLKPLLDKDAIIEQLQTQTVNGYECYVLKIKDIFIPYKTVFFDTKTLELRCLKYSNQTLVFSESEWFDKVRVPTRCVLYDSKGEWSIRTKISNVTKLNSLPYPQLSTRPSTTIVKFAVVIATFFVNKEVAVQTLKTLQRVIDQTHKQFKIYLIGDKFENEIYFKKFRKILEGVDHYIENLPFAFERDKYTFQESHRDNKTLSHCGGAYAVNYGISLAEKDGLEYVARLDHDDEWLPNHLEIFNNEIQKNNEYVFLFTKAVGMPRRYGSRSTPTPIRDCDSLPFTNWIHSSVCWNFKKLPFRYIDVYAETGKHFWSDAYIWLQIRNYMLKNKLKGRYINTETVIKKFEVPW